MSKKLIVAAMGVMLLTANDSMAQETNRETLLQNSRNLIVRTAEGQQQFYRVNSQQTYTVHRLKDSLIIGRDTLRTADIASLRFKAMDRFSLDELSSNLDIDSNVEAGLLAFRRSMNVGHWNTIVLPFNLSAEQVFDAFGNDALVAQATAINEDDAATVEFTVVNAANDRDIMIEQGKPYLIRPTKEPDIAEGATTSTVYGNSHVTGPVYLIDRVSVNKDDPKTVSKTTLRSKNAKVQFNGTFTATSIPPTNHPIYMLNDEGRFGLTEKDTPVNGFRSWIEVSKNTSELPMRFFINGIEEDLTLPTAIEATLMNDEQYTNHDGVYDLQGRRIANGNKPTAKGIYVVNGKKVIIR